MREIEEARARLAGDLEELAGRLPRIQEAGIEAGKKAAVPVAGAAAGAAVVWVVDKVLQRRRARREAEAAAAAAEDWTAAFRDGGWVGPATVAAGLWALVRIAEARSMKRLSKALVVAQARAAVPPPTLPRRRR